MKMFKLIQRLTIILLCILMLPTVFVSAKDPILPEDAKIRDIYIPDTYLVNPPSVVQKVDTKAKLDALQNEVRPQSAWLTLDTSVDHAVILGSERVSLDDAFHACKGKVIPILEIKDMATAEYVCNAVNNKVYDLIFVSDNTEVIKWLFDQKISYSRLGLISGKTDAAAIANDILSSGATICVLKNTDRKTAEYLQQRFLSVMINPNATNDELAVRAAVDCGANMVVMDGFQKAYDMYASVQIVRYVRRSFFVGHRGMVHYAPENSVEGLHEAFKNGADAVECDVWRTEDDQIVCFHNNYLEGSTTVEAEDPKKWVNTYTLEQLQAFTLKPKGEYTDCKIPTLDDMLAALKEYPGKILVIEIKDNKVIAPFVDALIQQYDVADQCVIIAFGGNQIDQHRTQMPTIGASLLNGGFDKYGLPLEQTEQAMKYLSGRSASFSPNYNIDWETIVHLNSRGITCNLWTAQTDAQMLTMAYHGAQFITTDCIEDMDYVTRCFENMSSDYIFGKYVAPTQPQLPVQEGNQPTPIWVWILISAGVLMLAGAALAVVLISKKKRSEAQ